MIELLPPGYSSSVRTTLQDPECTDRGLQRWDNADICGFNRSARRDLFPERNRASIMTKFNYARITSYNVCYTKLLR